MKIFLYRDDYRINNVFDNHKGLGKLGTIYVIIPCLPPHLQSKVENIYLLTLYKAEDLKHVSLERILSHTVEELEFLE